MTTKNKPDYDNLERISAELRESVMDMLAAAGSGHSAGPLGMAEMLTALYFNSLKHDPKNPDWDERDVVFLSHGHTAPILYAARAHAGYFPKEELHTLRKYGTRLQGHPERKALPGIESTSGPLGEGLSQGAGYAYTLKYLDNNPHRFVYVLQGDGEVNEGNVWEAAMFAAKYKLGQLISIIDRNFIQIDGGTEDVMPLGDLAGKWRTFGWHVLEVNGHSLPALINAYEEARSVVDRPSMIIANTIPGKGVDFMEYDFGWHAKPPSVLQNQEWLAGRSAAAAGFDYKAAEKESLS